MILTLDDVKDRLAEIGEAAQFIHLYSDRGDHIWYRNVPIGRLMLETDARTILTGQPGSRLRLEPRDRQ